MATPRFEVSEAELLGTLTGSTAAWFTPAGRGTVRVTGDDRVRFLNGMLSNDVAGLSAGQACEALQLDRKGHPIADLSALAFENEIWLDVVAGADNALLEMLEKHIIADDVRLETLSSGFERLSLEGSGAREKLQAIDVPAPEFGACVLVEWRGALLLAYGGGSFTRQGVRLLGSSEQLDGLREALELPLLDAAQSEALRIEAFVPAFGIDVSARNFPQEARLEAHISFTKGCYVGQEIVARIASRGAVNRLLVKIATSGPTVAGDEILAKGHRVGEVTSSTFSPLSGHLALGYVKTASATSGAPLEIAGQSAQVLGPPE